MLINRSITTVNTNSVARTLTLPQASSNIGRIIFVKDRTGNASVNNITVLPFSGETIESIASLVINTAFGSVGLVATTTGWSLITTNAAASSGSLGGTATVSSLTSSNNIIGRNFTASNLILTSSITVSNLGTALNFTVSNVLLGGNTTVSSLTSANIVTGSTFRVGFTPQSCNAPIHFVGGGSYDRTMVAEVSNAAAFQELLLYRGGSASDQIRIQTTGVIRFETVGSRILPTITQAATASAIISNNRVGIMCNSPSVELDVNGTINCTTLITNGIQYTIQYV